MTRVLPRIGLLLASLLLVACDAFRYQPLADFTQEGALFPPAPLGVSEQAMIMRKVQALTGRATPVSVRASARGAFSAADAVESLHVVFQADPKARHPQSPGRTFVLLQSEDGLKVFRPALDGDFTGITNLVRMPDGKDRVVLYDVLSGAGEVEVRAMLLGVGSPEATELELIKDFGVVYAGQWPSQEPGGRGELRASKLFYRGRAPQWEFLREHFTKATAKDAPWVRKGVGPQQDALPGKP